MLAFIQRQPAAIAGTVAVLIALGVTFGLQLSATQIGAIMAAVSALVGLVVHVSVTPNVSVPAAPNVVPQVPTPPTVVP